MPLMLSTNLYATSLLMIPAYDHFRPGEEIGHT